MLLTLHPQIVHLLAEQVLYLIIGKIQFIPIAAVEVQPRPHGWDEP